MSTWAKGSSASSSVRAAEYPQECRVSRYIGALPFLWLEIDDPPGPQSHRGLVERGAIALLSAGFGVERASPSWLGYWSDRDAVRSSGLWNVNHVSEARNSTFLEQMSSWVGRSSG